MRLVETQLFFFTPHINLPMNEIPENLFEHLFVCLNLKYMHKLAKLSMANNKAAIFCGLHRWPVKPERLMIRLCPKISNTLFNTFSA